MDQDQLQEGGFKCLVFFWSLLLRVKGSARSIYKATMIIRTAAKNPRGKRIQIFSPNIEQVAGIWSYINLGGKTK